MATHGRPRGSHKPRKSWEFLEMSSRKESRVRSTTFHKVKISSRVEEVRSIIPVVNSQGHGVAIWDSCVVVRKPMNNEESFFPQCKPFCGNLLIHFFQLIQLTIQPECRFWHFCKLSRSRDSSFVKAFLRPKAFDYPNVLSDISCFDWVLVWYSSNENPFFFS